jgi:hypothetical protein
VKKFLADKFIVRERFQRSTRIDADASDELEGFIFHETGKQILLRFFDHIRESKQRAYTWTGPYGSGKSTLALFLSRYLSLSAKERAKFGYGIQKRDLNSLDKSLGQFGEQWCVVNVSAKKSDIVGEIVSNLTEAVNNYWSGQKLPRELKKVSEIKGGDDLIASMLVIANLVVENGGSGLLLVVDELGNSLEFASGDEGDLHFFQELAEQFARSDAPTVFLGVLHQSFQEYANYKNRLQRNEWAKIQGRFEDTPFSVGIEESLKLIGQAIKGTKPDKDFKDLAQQVSNLISSVKYRNEKSLLRDLEECYPLHPLTALLLPAIGRQKFGQNERSVFSFLGSGEASGFKEFLNSTATDNKIQIYAPDKLWDYLSLNLEQVILASNLGHKWSESCEALSRSDKGTKLHLRVVKVIALFDLFGRAFSLNASTELLKASFPEVSKTKIHKIIKDLKNWSSITYRKHLEGWAISAGSDIDLDDATEIASQEIANDLAVIANLIPDQVPIVAKRHYYDWGTLRWFQVKILNEQEIDALETKDFNSACDGFFILILSTEEFTKSEIKNVWEKIDDKTRKPVAVGHGQDISGVIGFGFELAALNRISDRMPELQSDNVARRELYARIGIIKSEIRKAVGQTLQNSNWQCSNKFYEANKIGSLSEIASKISDKIYEHAPKIENELINRDKPSSSAVGARRVLMHQMVLEPERENLGIDGFPAEMGLYLSLIKKNKFHSSVDENSGDWQFIGKESNSFPESYQKLWDAADKLFGDTTGASSPKSFLELYIKWSEPPFGLKQGILPILSIVYLMSRSDELAIYVDGLFEHQIDDVVINRLLRNPTEVGVKQVSLKGINKDMLRVLAQSENTLLSGVEVKTSLNAAMVLAQFAHRLHPWVRRTNSLAEETKKVRSVLIHAKDPDRLLFKDLPSACGFENGITSKEEILEFQKRIELVHNELRGRFDKFMSEFFEELTKVFELTDSSSESLINLQERAKKISGKCGDFQLESIVTSLKSITAETKSIEILCDQVSDIPLKEWSDENFEKAKLRLFEVGIEFRRIERFATMKSEFISENTLYQQRENINESVAVINNLLSESTLGKDEQIEALLEALEQRMQYEEVKTFKDSKIQAAE